MRSDGGAFTDRDVHRYLRAKGVDNLKGEWFRCSVETVKAAVIAVREGQQNEENRHLDFKLRPEQQGAVEKTAAYFQSFKQENAKPPHFLWNAKMRFGKTFAAYQLAKKMGWKKLLVLTFKPAVQSAWEEDLRSHVDFCGWQFVSRGGLSYEQADKTRPLVCFGSFQDYLGRNTSTGGIKTKNEWVHATNWDCVILDEYHYGAWRDNARELFEAEDKKEADASLGKDLENFGEDIMPITTGSYLYLSGTPFRAIASGEFIEEQMFNWMYSDEQRAKLAWQGECNPYASLPRMVLLTYKLPDAIRAIAMQGEFSEFDLNVFFTASGTDAAARFEYEDEVQRWLELIRGAFLETMVATLKQGKEKPPMPFSDTRLLQVLSHTLWFLPSVAACYATRNLLNAQSNRFYHDYEVIVAADSGAGLGMNALMSIEGFRTLNQDIETIINKSESVKRAKKAANDGELSKEEKKRLSEEEKEYKNKRKQIQDKLIKFATRVPVFMYLTDYRERTLRDVITQLEPGLFKRVTGLSVTDFELLVSLDVFNSSLMNDAVYKFKRYKDVSLRYTGIDRHQSEHIGLYDTVIRSDEYWGGLEHRAAL